MRRRRRDRLIVNIDADISRIFSDSGRAGGGTFCMQRWPERRFLLQMPRALKHREARVAAIARRGKAAGSDDEVQIDGDAKVHIG
jgi:hypothetical protein